MEISVNETRFGIVLDEVDKLSAEKLLIRARSSQNEIVKVVKKEICDDPVLPTLYNYLNTCTNFW